MIVIFSNPRHQVWLLKIRRVGKSSNSCLGKKMQAFPSEISLHRFPKGMIWGGGIARTISSPKCSVFQKFLSECFPTSHTAWARWPPTTCPEPREHDLEPPLTSMSHETHMGLGLCCVSLGSQQPSETQRQGGRGAEKGDAIPPRLSVALGKHQEAMREVRKAPGVCMQVGSAAMHEAARGSGAGVCEMPEALGCRLLPAISPANDTDLICSTWAHRSAHGQRQDTPPNPAEGCL